MAEKQNVPSCLDGDHEKILQDKKLLKEIKREGIAVTVSPNGGQSDITICSLQSQCLSSNMPILSHLGFRIECEVSFELEWEGKPIFVRKYFIAAENAEQIKQSRGNIEAILEETLRGNARNSELNALAYLIDLTPRQIKLISAVADYQKQLLDNLGEHVIHSALIRYAEITKELLDYFETKFDPKIKNRPTRLKKRIESIFIKIKKVSDITDDRVLKAFFDILEATLRTNYFMRSRELFRSHALAIKVDTTQLYLYLNGVQPRIEAFVFHPEMQGVHHRRTQVSRGGLRWSDRHEDYRNEIRLLMQAQRQKNSIIIPSGAKGGFIIQQEGRPSREHFEFCYRLFIEALLDLVDNRDEKAVQCDEKVVAYDEEDTYFVVAADKGTAAMSDVANAISLRRKFWLGDAFASGGSHGYNHKEMGITAKGAIKSVERFFIEQNHNFYEKPVTVVGIGSPAGDVFGNGILLSSQFRLVAAISSREVFIDPEPSEKAHEERRRLFEQGLGWSSFKPEAFSPGGAVYRKDDKEITLSPEAKKLLGVKKETLNGEELTRAVLSAKVDMLFNGGVGTYVRASFESDREIGDKPNESVRVSARDIRATCVCEGGNLGFTQKARIEFARRGGRITCDSIDNSGGVQTSDYEVNLKIILNRLVEKNNINAEKRDAILKEMIPDIEQTVLWTNYLQSLSLAQDEIRSQHDLGRFKQVLLVLEEHVNRFSRSYYDLPGPDEFSQVLTKNGTLPRPLLAVLFSFAKTFVKHELLKHPEFLDSGFALRYLFKYFPKTFVTLYKKEIEVHPLKREIIATYIANKIVNFQGCGFIRDFSQLGEKRFLLKIRAFLAVDTLISANDIRYAIYRKDYDMPVKRQYELLFELERVVAFLTGWIVEHGEYETSLFDHLFEYQNAMRGFIESSGTPTRQITGDQLYIDQFFSMIDYVRMTLTIINVKESTHRDFEEVAELFYRVSQDLDIIHLINDIQALEAKDAWEERLKLDMEKNVIEGIYMVITTIIQFKRSNESIEKGYAEFIGINKDMYGEYLRDIKMLKTLDSPGYTPVNVVISSLKRMAHARK